MIRSRRRIATPLLRLDPITRFASALLRPSAGLGHRKQRLMTSVSRRLFFETLEPRVLLSADLNPIQGAIDVPGQVERYSFTLAQEKQILFDSETNSSSLHWSLTGPQGDVVTNRAFNSSDPVDNSSTAPLDLVSGTYTLSVQGVADATGTYQFRLLDLANATPIIPGTPVSDTLNPGNETNLYHFSANAGDQFYFQKQSLTGATSSTEWRLLDAYDHTIFANSLASDVNTTAMPSTGTYTLLIEGGVGNTAPINYGFNVQPVTNTTAALTLDGQTNGAITQPGQQNFFTFSLSDPSQLYFDSLTNDGSLLWTLSGPRGTEVSGRSFASSDASNVSNPVLSLAAGNYTVVVDGSGDHTDGYSFRLSDVASATVPPRHWFTRSIPVCDTIFIASRGTPATGFISRRADHPSDNTGQHGLAIDSPYGSVWSFKPPATSGPETDH